MIKKPLPPRSHYYKKLANNFSITMVIVGFSLLVGTTGYHFIAGLTFIDSFLNASMILTGMGPVNILTTVGAKIFASFYALFSGIIFLTVATIMLGPVMHRIMHKFHLENDDN
jgi:hypothetical protein